MEPNDEVVALTKLSLIATEQQWLASSGANHQVETEEGKSAWYVSKVGYVYLTHIKHIEGLTHSSNCNMNGILKYLLRPKDRK